MESKHHIRKSNVKIGNVEYYHQLPWISHNVGIFSDADLIFSDALSGL